MVLQVSHWASVSGLNLINSPYLLRLQLDGGVFSSVFLLAHTGVVCAVRLTVNVDCWGPSSDCSAAPRGQVLKQDIKDEELFHKLSPQTAGLFSCSQGFHTVKYYNNIDTVPELQMYWVKLGNWKEVSEYSNDDFFKIWMYSKFVKRLRTKKKRKCKNTFVFIHYYNYKLNTDLRAQFNGVVVGSLSLFVPIFPNS